MCARRVDFQGLKRCRECAYFRVLEVQVHDNCGKLMLFSKPLQCIGQKDC